MSVMDLLRALGSGGLVLTVAAFAAPLLVGLWARFVPGASRSRLFGHTASATIALGLVGTVFEVILLVYLSGKGVDLFEDLAATAIFAPPWLAFGGIWAATRAVPLAELRRYPLLRRVWSMLSVAALVFVGYLVLRHTYWLVFSGIIGFVIVAIIAYTLFQKLLKRATDAAPDRGDPDLFDEVADQSRGRVARLMGAMTRSPRKGKD